MNENGQGPATGLHVMNRNTIAVGVLMFHRIGKFCTTETYKIFSKTYK